MSPPRERCSATVRRSPRQIKDEVRSEVGLTASVGVATTKLVAKIASDLRKPDGLVVVPAGDEERFLAPLPIARLWGVGEKTAVALAEYRVRTIGDLAALPPDLVVRRFGKHGASLIDRARGMDGIRSTRAIRRSRSATSTRSMSTRAIREVIERTLLAMAEGVSGRLRSAGVRAATVAVKVRDSSFRTITRQRTLPEPTDLTEPIFRAALELARPEVRGIRVRLLGVTASGLGEREQLSLFEQIDPRHRRAVEAADALRRRYGERAVTRARLLGAGLPAPFERDPRNPLDRRARGVPAEPDPAGLEEERDGRRSVTAKVTQERTKFRSMTLDIEQAFGLVSGSNRTNVLSDECPERHDQRPRKGRSSMAFIRVNPVEVHVRTDWFSGRPREITWGDERLPVLGSRRCARRPPPTR